MGRPPTDKHALLVDLNVARADLCRALLDISADEFETAPVAGEWTLHDVIAHIAGWESWVCDITRALRAGRAAQVTFPASVDEFNAQAVALRRDWPLKQLLDEFTVAHRQLIVMVAGASTEQLEHRYQVDDKPFTLAGSVRIITHHDAEHTDQILEWKESRPPAIGPKLILQMALETNRSMLLALLDTIPPDQRNSLAVEGSWTAQDVCGHIADWDELFAEAIFAMERNERITWRPGDYGEEWNQTHALERRGQMWAQVWRDFVDRRGTILTELQERLTDADFSRTLPEPWGGEATLYRWLCIPCEHDAQHAASLLAWFRQ